MDKRYQVFVSSTFTDLQTERQAVQRSVLELDHMPAGMELFPASDESAWELIEEIIDSSDYYILIVGGRYGSQDETGLSFTEREYDYAVQTKKPVIPLLHRNPEQIERGKTETDAAAWERLQAFRAKVEKAHTCNYWDSAGDLTAMAIVGLTTAIKRHPGSGWVRADEVPTEATLLELVRLRDQIRQLEADAETVRVTPPAGAEELRHGGDAHEIKVTFYAGDYLTGRTGYVTTVSATWDEIFGAVAPAMINEATDEDLREEFRVFFESRARTRARNRDEVARKQLSEFAVSAEQLDTCIVQLRALGLIRESARTRSVRDTGTYWALTPYGDNLMTQLRALRRSSSVSVPVTPESDDSVPDIPAAARPAKRPRKSTSEP